jgi:hypothetical protein
MVLSSFYTLHIQPHRGRRRRWAEVVLDGSQVKSGGYHESAAEGGEVAAVVEVGSAL